MNHNRQFRTLAPTERPSRFPALRRRRYGRTSAVTVVLIAIAVTGLVLNIVNLVMSPVSFWDLIQLSDFGLFVQLVQNNPVLTIGSGALWLIGIGGIGYRMYSNR